MTKKSINFRAEDGLGAFRDETPFILKVKRSITAFADPVSVPPIVGDSIIFLDLSKWQGIIDFELMASRGIKAVWLKADQGVWTDSRFEENVKGALAAGLEVGFYHFADPEQTSVTPEQAAEHCFGLTNGIGRLSIWLDCERSGNFDQAQLLNYYVRWIERFRELDPLRIIEVYTRFSFFNSAVQTSNYWRNNKIGLDAARYHLGLQSPWSDGLYLPRDWDYYGVKFDKWQYSADGNGLGTYYGCESNSVDLNAFSGSWQDFEIYYGLSEIELPPPIDCPQIYAKIISANGLNFREYPDTGSRVWFALPQNTQEIEVLETIEDGNNVWLRTGQKQYCAQYYQSVKYCELYEI